MPLPVPRGEESQDDFVSRCIPEVLDMEEGLDPESEDDREQATAICFSQWREAKGGNQAANELRFACNVATAARRESWQDKEWLVVPVVALASGVLNGELVEPDEVLKHPEAWNGRPVVVYHPEDENGDPVSANSPEVLASQQIGQLFRVHATRNGTAKLKGEMWIDVARARELGGEALAVLRRLEANKPLEVSTAYFRDVEDRAGALGNKEYVTIARDIKPDHLAALPNQVGACSWVDGCGAPRVNKQREDPMRGLSLNLLSEARTPDYDGTTSGDWSAPDWSEIVSAYYERNPDAEQPEDSDTPDVSGAPAAVKTFAASLSLLGDAEAESFNELVYFPVVEPMSGNLNESALDAVIGGRGAQADAPAGAVESARRVAYRLLNEEFDRDLEFEPLGNVKQPSKGAEEMDELIERIVEDGRLGLNAEDLSEREEAELRGMLAVLEAMPVEEDPEEDPEPQTNAEPDPRFNAFMEAIDEVGGAEALTAVVRNFQGERKRSKDRMVARLVANEACTLSEDQLRRMETDQLDSLVRMLEPVDYTGLGANKLTDSGDEELAMPRVNWGTD